MATPSALDVTLDFASLTPQQHADLERQIESKPEPPLSPHAKRMEDLGVRWKTVRRIMICMLEFMTFSDGRHIWHHNLRCGIRSCFNCALFYGQKKYQEFTHVIGQIGTHFTHLELWFKMDAKTSPDQIRDINAKLRDILPGGVLAMVGYKDSQMVSKVLCTQAIDNATRINLAEALGHSVRVTAEVLHSHHFARILASIFAADVPNGRLAGDFEAALGNARQFRAIRLNSKPVIVSNPDTDLPLPEYEAPPGPNENIIVMHAKFHCPRCGRLAIKAKSWLPVTATKEMSDREPWRRIVLAP